MRIPVLACATAAMLIAATGCRVPNKPYRLDPAVAVVSIPCPKMISNKVASNKDKCWLDDPSEPQQQVEVAGKIPFSIGPGNTLNYPPLIKPDRSTADPQMAFIEFDDLGDAWSKPAKSVGTQIQWALGLIDQAKKAAVTTETPPLIMLYVHGWNHNAQDTKPSDEDQNVQGFKRVLLNLHQTNQRQIVVGIYIGWRGELYRDEWPVTQALSGWNRGDAATRIASDGPVTHALLQISHEVRYSDNILDTSSMRPVLIFSGHSYGALILQRALAGAWITELDSNDSPLLQAGIPPFADLTIFVNPAMDANQDLPLLDILAQKQTVYQVARRDSSGIVKYVDYPLFLSVTSPADDATRFLLPIGHFVPAMRMKWVSGSFRDPEPLSCYDPEGGVGKKVGTLKTHTEWDFSMTSAPHMEALQSHILIELKVDNKANPKTQALQESNIAECNPEDFADSDPALFDTYALPNRCFLIDKKTNRCNGTPYWIIDTNKDIIPAHSTIFTVRLIDLVERFLPMTREDSAHISPATARSATLQGCELSFDRPSLCTSATPPH